MTFEQAAILLLLAVQLIIFAFDRFRMEVVALGGLFAGIILGLVPSSSTFSGFASPAFVTVLEILLIVPALGRTGLVDRLASRLPTASLGRAGLLAVLCLVTAALSAFMNNIGALALMIPVVASLSAATGVDRRSMLMPVSFAALLGGTCSIIGTPANLIVSQQLAERTGPVFAFFDIAYAGIPAALAGFAAIIWWSRKVLRSEPDAEPLPRPRMIVSEIVLPDGSSLAGRAIGDFPGDIHALRRDGKNVFFQRPGTRIEIGDEILASLKAAALQDLLAKEAVQLAHQPPANTASEWIEAVVMPESTILGSRIATLEGLSARGLVIVAVATQNPRIEGSFADLRLGIGDVLYLRGDTETIREAAEEAEILLLWPQGRRAEERQDWMPVGVFASGVLLTAFGFTPPELAFGLVVLVLAAIGRLNLRTALGELNWPILIMLAAMIPLGFAVQGTGAAAVVAEALFSVLPSHHPLPLVAAILALAVAITPFVNNASTAIVLGPIAASLAQSASLPLEPFLVAVAVGASLDFLTPIGHHNNAVVMGIVGYRFTDFLKAGWPVTLSAYVAAVLAIWLFWF